MVFGKSKAPEPEAEPESPPPYSVVNPEQNDGVLLSTVAEFPGYKVTKIHGVVYGTTVRRGNRLFLSSSTRSTDSYPLSSEAYKLTSLVQDAREEAVHRMLEGVKATGANAAYGLRFDSEVMGEFGELSQICCCATAVSIFPTSSGKLLS